MLGALLAVRVICEMLRAAASRECLLDRLENVGIRWHGWEVTEKSSGTAAERDAEMKV